MISKWNYGRAVVNVPFQHMFEWKTRLEKWQGSPTVERPASIKKISGSIHALVDVYIAFSLLWALVRSVEVVDEHFAIFELQELQLRVVDKYEYNLSVSNAALHILKRFDFYFILNSDFTRS